MKQNYYKHHLHNKKPREHVTKPPVHFLTNLQTPIRLNGIEKLNEELILLYNKICPFKEEIAIRTYLISKMKTFIERILPTFSFHSFGSSETNLFLPSSDIDIVLINEDEQYSNKILKIIQDRLHESDFIDPSYVLHVKNARVPILKCRDKFFGFEFDIIINKENSIKQAQFIENSILNKPYLKPLSLLIKYFLKQRNLHDSRYGGLCSYAQFLMILHFTDLHPLVQQEKLMDPIKNLGVIIMDFFQFYGFDFPYEGVTLSIIDKCYKKNTISNAIISLEDPVDLGHDVGDNCIQMHAIKEVFQSIYRITNYVLKERIHYNESVLGLWMRLDINQEKWRKNVIYKYRSMFL